MHIGTECRIQHLMLGRVGLELKTSQSKEQSQTTADKGYAAESVHRRQWGLTVSSLHKYAMLSAMLRASTAPTAMMTIIVPCRRVYVCVYIYLSPLHPSNKAHCAPANWQKLTYASNFLATSDAEVSPVMTRRAGRHPDNSDVLFGKHKPLSAKIDTTTNILTNLRNLPTNRFHWRAPALFCDVLHKSA